MECLNLFRTGRYLLEVAHYRLFRERAFMTWRAATTDRMSA